MNKKKEKNNERASTIRFFFSCFFWPFFALPFALNWIAILL